MTLLEKATEQGYGYTEIIDHKCPSELGLEESLSGCDLDCVKCWEREMPGTEPREDGISVIPQSNDNIMELPESDFMTHIITTICDWATKNGYAVTDTVKTIGENLVAITEIATFDNWKVSGEDDAE